MNINQKREVILENLWHNLDFKDRVVAACNGWQRTTPDDYHCIFFLENGEASQRAVFAVKFEKGSLEVVEQGWLLTMS